MPEWVPKLGIQHKSLLWVPAINMDAGARILTYALRDTKDVEEALMEYNGGAKCIRKCPAAITYASKILKTYAIKLLKAQNGKP